MHAGFNRLPHQIGHAWPPEMLPQQDRVWSHPWWPAFLWHLFKVVTWWALGMTKSRRPLVSTLGIEWLYKAPWWIVKFCWFCKISLPSSLEACSARSAFKSVFFCAFSQFNTVLNIGSPLWSFSPISNMHLYKCTACSNTYLLLHAVVTLNYSRVMNFGSMCRSQCDSIED